MNNFFLTFLFFGLISLTNSQAQELSNNEIEKQFKSNYPKLWKEIEKIKKDGVTINYKEIRGPGAAQG